MHKVVVIGAGPGGYVAAIRAAQLGLSTALVDRRASLGGTCLNIGCIPSKALLESSELLARLRRDGAAHGLVAGDIGIDLPAMMKRKEEVVAQLTGGVARIMKARGVTVVRGGARIVAPQKVSVTDAAGREQLVEAESIVVATGSDVQTLPFLRLDGEKVVSSTEALSFARVPGRLLVVGAGAIGLEMGSVWARLGSQVTVVEIMPEVLPGWDGELARGLRRELSRQGIAFELGARVESCDAGGEVVLRGSRAGGAKLELAGDRVLVAVGRRPYTEGLGLEAVGVALEPKGGRIAVDGQFRTGVPGIYAIGDVIRGPMLAHKAEEEGIAVAEIIAGRKARVGYDCIPNVVYTSPEVASVGLSEEQLKDKGVAYRKGSFLLRANGRALALGEPAGFVKVLADAATDRILGVHILGAQASSVIAEAVAVMEFGGSAEDLALTVHAHPTLPEAVREAALAVDRRSLHGL
jgi:dihydrolipoamide dehydrogenase